MYMSCNSAKLKKNISSKVNPVHQKHTTLDSKSLSYM